MGAYCCLSTECLDTFCIYVDWNLFVGYVDNYGSYAIVVAEPG